MRVNAFSFNVGALPAISFAMASSGVSTVMVSATTLVLPSVALGCLHIASAIPTKSQHAALNVIVLFIFTFSVNSSANILLFSKISPLHASFTNISYFLCPILYLGSIIKITLLLTDLYGFILYSRLKEVTSRQTQQIIE